MAQSNNETSDTLVRGSGWKVEKRGEGYVFEFLAARHGGGVDSYKLSKQEFDRVVQGDLSFDELIEITDRDPTRHPFKTI